MGSITRRYDRQAERYERWWAPVLRPTVHAFLDEIAGLVDGVDAPTIVDVGTGTGSLAISATRRLPAARVVAVDGSRGMLNEARHVAGATLTAEERRRLDLRDGLADRLPLADRSVDLVVSSFVLQLVPDRLRALREAHRVLRPGGWVGYVAWKQDRTPFEPDAAWDRALDAAGAPDAAASEDDDRAGDIQSARAAAAQLRRAGFVEPRAREAILEQRWSRRSYLAFIERYDEADYLEGLEPRLRRRIHESVRRELARVKPTAFVWRTPVVMATARRPAGD